MYATNTYVKKYIYMYKEMKYPFRLTTYHGQEFFAGGLLAISKSELFPLPLSIIFLCF